MRLTSGFRKVLLFHVSVCTELLYLDVCDRVENSFTLFVKSFLIVGKFIKKPSKCINYDNKRNKK